MAFRNTSSVSRPWKGKVRFQETNCCQFNSHQTIQPGLRLRIPPLVDVRLRYPTARLATTTAIDRSDPKGLDIEANKLCEEEKTVT